MAFQETKGRYASFGVVTSLPGEVIDHFWFIIDNYLKGVLPLKKVLRFSLKNRKGKLSITFSQEGYKEVLTIDFQNKFDPFFPSTVLVFDKEGQETVALPKELNYI
ncbi:TPA: DUF960 domain-containing protein [Streptococcus suis]|nr:DUF960 domain-containing protein [Streptococcus suis]MDW8742174.1 DUF960 domain-containing protein [Streptococcus suis]NJW39421.1 DUF960 domain-containing protein [Streptococcus suis]NQH33422.1 DUF960 domain-containing protein [Streptococcus suis]NQH97205.1 DUF960 domain-containing protein [Streptococcus suis]NQI34859.1 DUF960 domain-containing protein [Streptococcus suis]